MNYQERGFKFMFRSKLNPFDRLRIAGASAGSKGTARGSVLIMALWALLILSGAIFAWVKFINQTIEMTGERNNGLEAKALAHSGVVVAMSPDVTQITPLLKKQFSDRSSYQVQMKGAGGKLNLNWIFENPQAADPVRIELWHRYLDQFGLNIHEKEALTDCILDWLDQDNLARLNGAEDEGTYHPPNRGFFLSVQELTQVKNSKPLVSKGGWDEDLMVLPPGAGQAGVDLQAASMRVLKTVLNNVPQSNLERFVKYRQGEDGLDGTPDDYLFKDTGAAESYLGMGVTQVQAVQGLVYIQNPANFVEIKSTGHYGNVTRRVEVVANKAGNPPIILTWKEL